MVLPGGVSAVTQLGSEQPLPTAPKAHTDPQEDAGLMKDLTTRLKGLFVPSTSQPAEAGASSSNSVAPVPAAHESDDPSSGSLEGRACGDSAAGEISASCVFVAFSSWCLPAESVCDGGGASTHGLISRRVHMLGANALVFVSVWCLQARSCSGKRGKSFGSVKVPGVVCEKYCAAAAIVWSVVVGSKHAINRTRQTCMHEGSCSAGTVHCRLCVEYESWRVLALSLPTW
jgi:hypothetical protein